MTVDLFNMIELVEDLKGIILPPAIQAPLCRKEKPRRPLLGRCRLPRLYPRLATTEIYAALLGAFS
jgi:hypothetical protein